ncbi:MAG: permease-like cell division protein FtsX [Acidiferrobacter sp.]
MIRILTRHLQVFITTLGDFARDPVGTVLAIAVIGITLALPAGLYVGLANLERLGAGWHRGGALSVYLHRAVGDRGAAVAAQIGQLPGVRRVAYVSPAAGLRTFRRLSGFGATIAVLHHNPLPPVVLVTPQAGTPAALATVIRRLRALPDVALVQSNLRWLERLDALLALGHRLVWIVGGLLGLAVILILGNTVRVAVMNRATEIEVIRLVGGTDGFIRRPFLYAGTLQGALGALCACLLVEISMALLDGPAHTLLGLYARTDHLQGLSAAAFVRLIAGGGLLGWCGARLAVSRQLRKRPSSP